MFPISPDFSVRFHELSATEKARHASEALEGPDDNKDIDSFGTYVAAHERIAARGWRSAEDIEVAEQLLSNSHNTKVEKLVDQCALYVLAIEEGRRNIPSELIRTAPFAATNDFADVLPHLDFSRAQLNSLLTEIRDVVLGDLAQQFVFEVLQRWAQEHPSEALGFLNDPLEVDLAFALQLATGAVEAGNWSRDALLHQVTDWLDQGGRHSELAVVLLPQIVRHETMTGPDALRIIEEFLSADDGDLASAALFALGKIAEEWPSEKAASLLRRQINDKRARSRFGLSDIIWRSARSEIIGLTEEFLVSVASLPSTEASTIRNVDHILSKRVESDVDFVFRFLKAWITEHEDDQPRDLANQTRFVGTFSKLRSRREAIQAVASYGTTWLTLEPAVAKAGAFLLDDFHVDAFSPSSVGQFSDAQLKILMDRTLAFHFGEPINKFRLLHSLLPFCASPTMTKLLHSAFHEIGLNYPGVALEFIGGLADDDDVAGIRAIMEEMEATYAGPSGRVAILGEFLPPTPRREAYYRHERKQLAEVNKSIQESGDYTLYKLARKVNLGRGNTWAVAVTDGRDPLPPSKLAEMSYTIMLPKLEFLDPDLEAWKRLIRIYQWEPRREASN